MTQKEKREQEMQELLDFFQKINPKIIDYILGIMIELRIHQSTEEADELYSVKDTETTRHG